MLIPAASFRDAALPRPGSDWRLNATLETWGTAAEARSVCQWGYPDLDNVLHGMIVQFFNADSQP